MMAVPSSPTRRQTGFNPTMDSTSTRTRNDTSSTIIPDSKDKIQTEQHFIQQPLPIPGTITTSQPHHQSSQSPSELPTPPDAEALLNFSIPTSINSQSSQNHVREDQKGVVLDSLVPVSTAAPTPTPTSNHSYPTSSTPGSLTSSSLGLSNSNSRNLNGNGNNGISLGSWNVSGSQRSSLGFGYSPYSTKSSGFKISSERGGSNVSPNPNSASPRTREPNTSIELEGTPERDSRMEGEGTGDSAGVFSFSSPYFGPQISNNQDEDLDGSEIDVDISGGDVKSPGWAAITLGQLSLSGNPNDSGGGLSTSPYLSTSTNRQGAVGGISSSRGGGGGSVPMVASNSGSGSSTNASRRYPPISSSNRPSNNRTNSGLSSSFQSGSPASRSLPSADDAIQAAAMHRRASYNRTASGAPRTSFGTSGPPSSFSFGASGVGNGSPGSPSPMGIVASSSMTSNGSSRFGRKSGGGGRRRASRSRDRAKVNVRGKGRVTADGEFDDDATDDDEMALDVNDEDDDTEDELLVGKNGGRVGSESVVGDMDQDSEMEESESGSTYGESQKRMGGNGWSINSNGIGANRNLSGYYTSTRGEYVGNSKLSTSGGSSSLSRPSLLDRARNSASQSPSLGLTLNNGIPTNSSRSFNNGFDSPRGIGGGGMSSSFNNGIGIGTSPNSSGRHHPYAQSPRSVSGSFGASNGSPSTRSNLTSSNPISTNLKRGGFGESNNNSSLSASSSNSRIGVSPLSKGGSSSSGTIGTSSSPRNPSSNLPPLVTRGSSKRSSTQQEPPEEDNLSGSGDETESSEEISSSSIPKSKPSTSPSTSLSTSNSKKVVSNVNDDGTTAASAAAIRNRLGGASNCSAFISKLWHLMSNPEKYRDYIRWSEGGDSIILFSDNQKQDAFAKEVLPKLFKHGNVASFVRQLNLYGFQRVPTSRSLDDAEQSSAFQALSSNQSGLSSNWSSRKSKHQIASSAGAFYGPHSAFVHPNFMRGGEDRLPSMKPRSSKGKKNTEKDVDQEDEGPTKENGDRLDGNGMEIAGKIKKRGQVTKVAGHQQEESDDEDDLAFD